MRKQTSPEGECQPGPEKFEGEEGEDTVDRLVDQSIVCTNGDNRVNSRPEANDAQLGLIGMNISVQ